MAGEVTDRTGARATVTKVDANGNPARFGDHGVVVLNPGANTTQSLANAVALDANEMPIASGAVLKRDGRIRGPLVKLTGSGTPDSTFGQVGSVEVDALPSEKTHFTEFNAVTVDAHNRIVVTGPTRTDAGKSTFFTTRLLANGAQDLSFTPAFGDGQISAQPSSVDVDGAGRIVVSGPAADGLLVYRLKNDGTPDTAFAQAGRRQFDIASLLEYSTLTAKGDIVVYSRASDAIDAVLYELQGD